MKDQSDEPSHHEQMLLPQSYISLPIANKAQSQIDDKLPLYQWSTGWNEKKLNESTMKDRSNDPSDSYHRSTSRSNINTFKQQSSLARPFIQYAEKPTCKHSVRLLGPYCALTVTFRKRNAPHSEDVSKSLTALAVCWVCCGSKQLIPFAD